ncbi:uncharacterized protein LOC135809963 [Sycon ciliatum]|uniref:uncharacterized protein LOC135809963 n=1 Tax=Sycon ciliatum TaxID=27933 RepID=UPI0031F64E0B
MLGKSAESSPPTMAQCLQPRTKIPQYSGCSRYTARRAATSARSGGCSDFCCSLLVSSSRTASSLPSVLYWFIVALVFLETKHSHLVAAATTTVCRPVPASAGSVPLDVCACAPATTTLRPCSSDWLASTTLDSTEPVMDHRGQAWTPGDREEISGIHCNISTFHVRLGRVVRIKPWTGGTGGRLALEVTGNVVIEGSLDGKASGYRGGPARIGDTDTIGHQGESYASSSGSSSSGSSPSTAASTRNGGGGGGGKLRVLITGSFFVTGRPGAGAGYGRVGTDGTSMVPTDFSEAGNTYGDSCLSSLYPGSGGGAGANSAQPTLTPEGGRGGNGGGAVFIFSTSGNISVAAGGSILMDGETGAGDGSVCGSCPASCAFQSVGACQSSNNTVCHDFSGAGGGGSGGSIHLSAATVDIQGSVAARGGRGGVGAFTLSGCGGDGGDGRVRIDANRIIGTSSPARENGDVFSFCPCNASVTTPSISTTPSPTATPNAVTTARVSTSQAPSVSTVVSDTASRSVSAVPTPGESESVTTAGEQPGSLPRGVSLPSDQSPTPTSLNPSQATTTHAVDVGGLSQAALSMWLVGVIIASALLLIINLVMIVAFCRIRRRRKSPVSIPNNQTPAFDTYSPPHPGPLSRCDTQETVTSATQCMICHHMGPMCVCPKPNGHTNPAYGDAQIPFSIPASPTQLQSPSSVTTRHSSVNSQEPLIQPTGAQNGGSRHYSSSNVMPKQSEAHNYDLVEGGPGTVATDNSFRNPNYGMRIPVQSASQATTPQGPKSPAMPNYANVPVDSPNEYANHTPGHAGITAHGGGGAIVAGRQRSRSVTSPGSSQDIRMDASGYLLAEGGGGGGVGVGPLHPRTASNASAFAIHRRDGSSHNSVTSPMSECSRTTQITSDGEAPSVFRFQDHPSAAMHTPQGQGVKPRTSSAHSSPLASPTSPPGQMAGRADSDVVRKDSGIEADASCYSVVPVPGLPDVLSGMPPSVTQRLDFCHPSEIRRPPSAEPAKNMSPIPEQISPTGDVLVATHGGGASSGGRRHGVNSPPPTDSLPHQYAHISEILPPLQHNADNQQEEDANAFSVSSV